VSERDGIERAALYAYLEPMVGNELAWDADHDAMDRIAAAIRALPPAEPDEPTVEMMDPRTGRPLGDHGTASEAIDFALDYNLCTEPDTFLRSWRMGSLDEWPEFYEWLALRAARPAGGREGGE